MKYTKNDLKRFWDKVNKTETCWNWIASKRNFGYGHFSIKNNGKWISMGAHRFSYILHFGQIPHGALICHHCDNTSCIRPEHIYAGTYSTNNQDAFDRKRKAPTKTVCNANGIKNINAKLTDKKIKKIRTLYKQENISQTDIGKLFGVSQVLIGLIVNNKIWKHVSP